MKDVAGKTAFITGGASGVGLGLAQVFSKAGMKVIIADIRQDHLDAAMKSLSDIGAQAHPVQVDVADRQSVADAADEAERVFGPVHVLCNNAGVNLFGPMDEASYDDWDWVLGVNLGGVVNGIHTFIPRMKAHGEGGHIINTASMASFIAGPGAGIYTTAKFAVRGLSETLRYHVAEYNIGVSVLCPGLVKSTIYESEKVRPEHLSGSKGPVNEEFMARLKDVHEYGMDPVEVGEKTLKALKRGDFYIFPHPEFKEELRGIFDEILAAFPDEEPDPDRLAFEEDRRRRLAEAKAKLPKG